MAATSAKFWPMQSFSAQRFADRARSLATSPCSSREIPSKYVDWSHPQYFSTVEAVLASPLVRPASTIALHKLAMSNSPRAIRCTTSRDFLWLDIKAAQVRRTSCSASVVGSAVALVLALAAASGDTGEDIRGGH